MLKNPFIKANDVSVSRKFDPPDKKYRIHDEDVPTIKRYKK